jgi:gamma-glutamyl hercynylcysteine S-oxide synthase
MPALISSEELRAQLRTRLLAARARTDSLFQVLTPQGLLQRPILERHRFIFYLGHLEAFDFNLLCRQALQSPSLDAHKEQLFAFGIDPPTGSAPLDTPEDWPAVSEILAWTKKVRSAVDEVIEKARFEQTLEQGWAAHLAIEHRLMHAETLCYALCQLGLEWKRPGPVPVFSPSSHQARSMSVRPGRAILGLSKQTHPFLGWDNEYERHEVFVPEFNMSQLPISNRDWLHFMEQSPYENRVLWSDADWHWIERDKIRHPAFWTRHGDAWQWVGMFGHVELPLDAPVYVSHAEASAYARFHKAQLPTESQWHRAAWGDGEYAPGFNPESHGMHGNFGALQFDPVTSGHFSRQTSGFVDLIGNGWEWTSTVFEPFAQFQPLPFYQGYSENFFDGHHFVLKGASAQTDVTFLRPSFRNWFQPHYQYVFAKFRLVTS